MDVVDPSEVKKMFPPIHRLKLNAKANATIDNLIDPVVDLKCTIKDSEIIIPGTGIKLSGGCDITKNKGELNIIAKDSENGTATITRNGNEFGVSLNDFRIINLPESNAKISGSLIPKNKKGKLYLVGDIEISGTNNIKDRTRRASADIVENENPTKIDEVILLDIKTRIANTTIRSNNLKINIGGDILISGNIAAPELFGTVDILGGTIEKGNIKLQAKPGGSIVFSGKHAGPRIDITMSKKIKDIEVGVQATGIYPNINTTMYSNKSLSDIDILSYIVFGKPSSGDRADIDILLSATGLIFGSGDSTAITIKQNIQRAFGIDDIFFTTKDGDVGIGAKKKLGKVFELEVLSSGQGEVAVGISVKITEFLHGFIETIVDRYNTVGIRYKNSWN